MNKKPLTYGFIHIPRNGGTSISSIIKELELPIGIANHFYRSKPGLEEIVVLRCPVSRFLSAFCYGKKYWPNPVNHNFTSPNELAESAADPNHPKHSLAWTELGNKPSDILKRNLKPDPQHSVQGRITDLSFVYEPQLSWMINSPRHVLRFNHLEKDFGKLLRDFGILDTLSLQILNRSDYHGNQRMSSKALEFIREIYNKDFALIDSLGLELYSTWSWN